jgi:hypothetical protein
VGIPHNPHACHFLNWRKNRQFSIFQLLALAEKLPVLIPAFRMVQEKPQ